MENIYHCHIILGIPYYIGTRKYDYDRLNLIHSQNNISRPFKIDSQTDSKIRKQLIVHNNNNNL